MRRAFGLLVVAGTILSVVVLTVAQVYAAISERSVTYRYLAEALSPLPEPWSAVQWSPGQTPLARPLTPVDARMIGLALTDAWQAVALAQSTGDTEGMKRALSGVALERALLATRDARTHGTGMAVLEQRARPVFFHLDGSLFQAEVEMLVARHVIKDDVAHHEVTLDRGIVTLMNEVTGWRLFSYERTSAEDVTATAKGWQGEVIKGVNYYPADTPWAAFWPGFDEDVVRADLRKVRGLNANTVRIFLPRKEFLDPSSPALTHLADFLRIAEDEGVAVMPTLFDMRGSYGPVTWAADADLLRRVLPVLAASPAVIMVDLKNEPDHDFHSIGKAEVQAWLLAMISVSRRVAPDLPLTIGWASAERAPLLADKLDAVSYHDYAPLADTAARLAKVRAAVGDRAVLVTEIGGTSWGLVPGTPSSQTRQAKDLATRTAGLKGADGIMVWTLHDFDLAATSPVAKSPWSARLQTGYGLFDRSGAEKLAADIVRKAFATAP